MAAILTVWLQIESLCPSIDVYLCEEHFTHFPILGLFEDGRPKQQQEEEQQQDE